MLHKSKLEDFAKWAEERGWKRQKTKGDYEVLRMKWPGEPPMIIYTKLEAKEHYTTYEIGDVLVRQWIRDRKQECGQGDMK